MRLAGLPATSGDQAEVQPRTKYLTHSMGPPPGRALVRGSQHQKRGSCGGPTCGRGRRRVYALNCRQRQEGVRAARHHRPCLRLLRLVPRPPPKEASAVGANHPLL